MYSRYTGVILVEHGGVVLMVSKPDLSGFLQYFGNVGWVIWFVPEMTYKVSSGTLSHHFNAVV